MTITNADAATIMIKSNKKQLEEELFGKDPTQYDNIVHYMSALTEEKKQKLQQFIHRVRSSEWVNNLGEYEKSHVVNDDRCCFRVLSGFYWDQEMAYNMIQKICKWRADKKPYLLTLKDLGTVGKTHLVQQYGFDKNGRPVMYVNMSQLGDSEHAYQKFLYIVWGIEKCLRRMNDKVYNITCIFDMKDSTCGMSHITKMKDWFLELGNMYPECLNVNIICNVSWAQSMLWKVVSVLIDKTVLDRYKIVRHSSDPSELHKLLFKVIDPSQVLQSLGGPVKNPYHYDKLVQFEELCSCGTDQEE